MVVEISKGFTIIKGQKKEMLTVSYQNSMILADGSLKTKKKHKSIYWLVLGFASHIMIQSAFRVKVTLQISITTFNEREQGAFLMSIKETNSYYSIYPAV